MGFGVYVEFEEYSGMFKGFVFGFGWVQVRFFVFVFFDVFCVLLLFVMIFEVYVVVFQEVKEFGVNESSVCMDDQKYLVFWWKDFVESFYNWFVCQFVCDEVFDLEGIVCFFVQFNVVIFDVYVFVFDNKFYYNYWCFYIVICWVVNDGNEFMVVDFEWINFYDYIYVFFLYFFVYGIVCMVVMIVFEGVFGKFYVFIMMIFEVDLVGLFFEKIVMLLLMCDFLSFDEVVFECLLLWIYFGIYFCYDLFVGYELGVVVGKVVLESELGSGSLVFQCFEVVLVCFFCIFCFYFWLGDWVFVFVIFGECVDYVVEGFYFVGGYVCL